MSANGEIRICVCLCFCICVYLVFLYVFLFVFVFQAYLCILISSRLYLAAQLGLASPAGSQPRISADSRPLPIYNQLSPTTQYLILAVFPNLHPVLLYSNRITMSEITLRKKLIFLKTSENNLFLFGKFGINSASRGDLIWRREGY